MNECLHCKNKTPSCTYFCNHIKPFNKYLEREKIEIKQLKAQKELFKRMKEGLNNEK